MSTRSELRIQKRKEVVGAIVVRREPLHLVARVYAIPQRTIFDWLSLYRSGGWDALKEGRRCGRPRKLSGEEMKWIYRVVKQGNPQQFQFEFCLWTLKTLRTLIERELGVKLSKSSLGRLLGHLGLSAQRPVYQSYRQDSRKVDQYLAETFPAAAADARKRGAQVYFADEASVRSDAHRGTTWGKIGETPIVENSGGRFRFNLISAVSPRGDMRFSFIAERMDSNRFIAFLKKPRKDAGKPILAVVDNARYHHSKETQRFIKAQQGEITLAFLPACTPAFNPDEQVWNHTTARLGNRSVLSKDDMKQNLLSILRSIQKAPALIKRSFRMRDTKYILDSLA
ncbi:MAG: IS630 family transposase [Thiohalocapsa sp.]